MEQTATGDDTMRAFLLGLIPVAVVLGVALNGPWLNSSVARTVDPEQNLKDERTIQGKLQSVDLVKNTITVLPEGATALVIELTDQTKIRIGEKSGTREDLKAGQKVKCVHTTKEGKHICESLTVELTK
jgi:N-acetylglucosamine-6-phosphate deacetylase